MATLQAIEQETSRHLGPFRSLVASATTASTATLLVADVLASTATPGDLVDLFVLRRGYKADGTAVGGFVSTDRTRLVKLYDPDGTQGNGVAGSLLVGRPWALAPVANEAVELCALHPDDELRPSVLRGLDRCYVRDRVPVALAGYAAERDMTLALPWLTRPQQLRGAAYLPTGSLYPPRPLPWFEPYEAGGHVWLRAGPDPWPFQLLLDALRPASSLVNNLAAPASPPATDVATGGSLAANTAYWVAVTATTDYGTTPASVPVLLYTANDGNATHAARLAVGQVAGANSYGVYLSTAAAPLLVATITEAQRAAGCTITAQATVTATSPALSTVDVRVVGSGAAAVQATGPTADTDVLPVDAAYGAAAACCEAWRMGYVRPRLLPAAAGKMAPSQDECAAWFARLAQQRLPREPRRQQLSAPFGPRTAGAGWWV